MFQSCFLFLVPFLCSKSLGGTVLGAHSSKQQVAGEKEDDRNRKANEVSKANNIPAVAATSNVRLVPSEH